MPSAEDRDWQRLDKWLWCARFLRHRADCVRLAAGAAIRVNRVATDKPHARLRVGDVVTLPLRDRVVVLKVLALAARRGPAPEARTLYRELAASPPDEHNRDFTVSDWSSNENGTTSIA